MIASLSRLNLCATATIALAVSSSVTADPGAISKIIGPFDPFPDETQTVRQIREAVFDEAGANEFLVLLYAGLDSTSFQALYRVNAANQFQRIAAAGTATSRGAIISQFGDYTSYGTTVYFVAFDTAFKHYLCKVTEPGGPVTVLAANDDLIAGEDRYAGFVGGLSAHADGLVFDANVNRNSGTRFFNDVFYDDGTKITSLIGYGTTPVPGFDGGLFYMNKVTAPAVRNGEVVFLGEGLLVGFSSATGIYGVPLPGETGSPRKLVDSRDKAPGSAQTLNNIGRSQLGLASFDFDNNEVAFYGTSFGNTDAGFYRHTVAGGIVTVANRETLVPGTTSRFSIDSFGRGELSLSGGRMVFRIFDEIGNDGIYLHQDGSLAKLISTGQEVEGIPLNTFTVHRHGLSGNQLVFSGNFGLYRATLSGGGGPTPTPVSLQIIRNGEQVTISWDATAAGTAAELQSTQSLTPPAWQKVAAQSNPFPVGATDAGAQYFRLKQ